MVCATYGNRKDSVQFPIDKPLPLITKIVKFRIKENLAKSQKEILSVLLNYPPLFDIFTFAFSHEQVTNV